MKIKTLYDIGDKVTFYPAKTNKSVFKGMIVDLFIYLGCGELKIMYVVQSGEQGYHVYENQIISGKRFKRREKACEVPLSD